MFKKLIPLATLMALILGATAAYADPLDPDHFKAGVWRGTYTPIGCNGSYKGTATLVVTNPSYDIDPERSQVVFQGKLTLTGQMPAGFPDYSNGVQLDPSIIRGPEQGGGYLIYIIPSEGPVFNNDTGYNPTTQEMHVSGSIGACKINIDMYPAS